MHRNKWKWTRPTIKFIKSRLLYGYDFLVYNISVLEDRQGLLIWLINDIWILKEVNEQVNEDAVSFEFFKVSKECIAGAPISDVC